MSNVINLPTFQRKKRATLVLSVEYGGKKLFLRGWYLSNRLYCISLKLEYSSNFLI